MARSPAERIPWIGLLIQFSMNRIQKTLSLILLAAVLLLIVFLPKYVGTMLERPGYVDWLRPKREAFRGTLTVWHVVRFRPYLGSLGSWLKQQAQTIEKRHFGVYLNVEALTEEDAAARLALGEMPDIISFPPGFIAPSLLSPLSIDADADLTPGVHCESLLALPFAASCRLILYYPGMISPDDILNDLSSAEERTFDDFKSEKAAFCIADARQAGDMARLVSSNKAQYFETLPFEKGTQLVQFLGLSASIAEEKRPYAHEFLELAVSAKAQSGLSELGLLPLNENAEAKYEVPFLSEAYELIRNGNGADVSAFGAGE